MATTVAVVARVQLFASLAVANVATVTRTEVLSRSCHLAARIFRTTVAVHKAVVNGLTCVATASPTSLAHTTVPTRTRHLALGLLVALSDADASFVFNIAVVDRKT
jgi:hypothetical protein